MTRIELITVGIAAIIGGAVSASKGDLVNGDRNGRWGIVGGSSED
jgi:hypothetical protein